MDHNSPYSLYLSRKVFSSNPNEMSLRGTKQSPIVGGDCFGKNALAMTFAKKAERTYLEDYIREIGGSVASQVNRIRNFFH
jgi:hypothetical protein